MDGCEIAHHSIYLTKTDDIRDIDQKCDEFEGISINPTPERLGVTDIVNEACTSVAIGVGKTSTFIKGDSSYQDLLNYLARPRVIQSGSIITTRGPFIGSNVTRTALTSWFPQLNGRLAGVYGIRFTIKFTLVVAATPFQQALLCQSFQYGAPPNSQVVYPRAFNSAMATNLPHVLHDIAETTMSELEVPFLYAYDFMPLTNSGVNQSVLTAEGLGEYSANTLMPYRTLAGVNAPTYKLMVSLHNLELIGSYPTTYNAITVQSGLSGSAVTKEEKSVRGSDKVLALSAKVRTISSYIPFLSSIGSTTSNVMDLAANVARVFGFSKPQLLEPPNRVVRSSYIGEANVDMPSASFVLAPFQSNRLAVDALAGGTDVDEMAIQYVIGRYGQVFVGNMATVDAAGTALYAAPICPTSYWFRTNSGRPGGNIPLPAGSTAATNSIALSPLAYVAQFFRLWRGTLHFRITFSKTKFHGGRVMIGYVPELDDNITNTVPSLVVPIPEVASGSPQPFSYSKIFDLRDGSVVEFEVPYVSHTPFTGVQSSTGGISMIIMDPLVVSGEVASTIDYMVEVKAGDDFEFACPAPPMFGVAVPGSNSTNIAFLQSGLGGISDIGEANQYTVGENIRSLKQLMMIPSWILADFANLTITNTTLWPFWLFGRPTPAIPYPATTSARFGMTRSGCIAAMYAYATGSTEHHAVLYGPPIAGFSQNIAQVGSDCGVFPSSQGDPRVRGSTGAQRVITSQEALHVRVPSYQRTARVPIYDGNTFNNFTVGSSLPLGAVTLTNSVQHTVNNQTGGNVRIAFGRSAGEDARCVGYIGPPPVVLLQGTQTSVFDSSGAANL